MGEKIKPWPMCLGAWLLVSYYIFLLVTEIGGIDAWWFGWLGAGMICLTLALLIAYIRHVVRSDGQNKVTWILWLLFAGAFAMLPYYYRHVKRKT
jgi:hypothetical protein